MPSPAYLILPSNTLPDSANCGCLESSINRSYKLILRCRSFYLVFVIEKVFVRMQMRRYSFCARAVFVIEKVLVGLQVGLCSRCIIPGIQLRMHHSRRAGASMRWSDSLFIAGIGNFSRDVTLFCLVRNGRRIHGLRYARIRSERQA